MTERQAIASHPLLSKAMKELFQEARREAKKQGQSLVLPRFAALRLRLTGQNVAYVSRFGDAMQATAAAVEHERAAFLFVYEKIRTSESAKGTGADMELALQIIADVAASIT